MNDKKAYMAGTGDKYSWVQLFNPLSFFMGGGDRYPEFMDTLLPGHRELAFTASKVGAVSLLAAALAGGTRAVQHAARMQEIADSDDPSKNIRSDLGTTFSGTMDTDQGDGKKRKRRGVVKTAANIPWPSVVSPKNLVYAGLPIAAFTLAAAASYRGADSMADDRRAAILDKAIANKRNTIRNLMKVRAQQARGVVSDAEVAKALEDAMSDENYVKTAGEDPSLPKQLTRGALTGAALLVLGLGGAATIGSYKYFSASDPNNIRYNAIRKGLREYARAKAAGTPLTIAPTDAGRYFSQIAGPDETQEKSVRELPELTSSSRPISMTL